MLKRTNGRPVPNNPAKAYELGRLDGTKQCMDNVSCVLLDKCGFHNALWSWWRPKTTAM